MSDDRSGLRTLGLGLGTLAIAGIFIAAALLVQRAPVHAAGDADDTSMGDIPHLPPAAIRRT
jgi:hypothetical protein